MPKRDEFTNKLWAAEKILQEEWDYVNPADIVIGFMCLWKISEEVPAMALVWDNVKKRLPKFTSKIEEAWPRGKTGETDGTEQHYERTPERNN